jgi:hypothetical protein
MQFLLFDSFGVDQVNNPSLDDLSVGGSASLPLLVSLIRDADERVRRRAEYELLRLAQRFRCGEPIPGMIAALETAALSEAGKNRMPLSIMLEKCKAASIHRPIAAGRFDYLS